MNQKGFAPVLILVGVVIATAIGGAYYLGIKKPTPPTTPTPIVTSQPPQATTNPSQNIDDWQEFTNEQFNFSFKYPSGWIVKTQEGINSLTTTITSPSKLEIIFLSGKSLKGGDGCYEIPTNMDFGYEEITVFNEQLNLFYFGDKTKNKIAYAYIIKGSTPCNNNAYFDIPDQVNDPKDGLYTREGSIHISYADNQVREVEIFKGTDLQTAKEIIGTFKVLNP